MPRQSSIKRLPKEIQELIGKLRENGRTIDEILAKLKELDAGISRSALGRHVKRIDDVGKQIRRSREVADALVRRLGEAPENRQLRLNVEMMHSLFMDLLIDEDGEPVTLSPKDARFLAGTLNDLARAAKTDADLVVRLRKDIMAEAADKAEEAAVEAGLTKARAADLRRQVLGVRSAK